ncbi:response regulator transcription factor [Micromonospora maris]|uniref:LuxR family transcriptional regulator n=1 Tax=Micromonospora maris TaxID=1003110 RepID=A0A9X0I149_9ACTN|nr:response regulator transcription factor [Micromonospora maris]AEB45448.1 NarL family two-component response regulator [Micromonospora maris AB-18-032]KUJ44827.1 LuxR family transcriptional regulator [Micromonospora maris]
MSREQPERPIRVAVVDDHPVFRLGMTALLGTLIGIECVGEAVDVDSALDLVAGHLPDVVLMDLHLGDRSGVEATRLIRARHPEVAVLVVTMFDDDDSLFGALRAGASGYLLKGAAPQQVERGVRAVANGELLLGPEIGARAVGFFVRGAAPVPFPQLTDREREILDHVAQGLDNATIAHRLALSPKTVRNHLSNILVKIGVGDRAQAIVRAREQGLGRR